MIVSNMPVLSISNTNVLLALVLLLALVHVTTSSPLHILKLLGLQDDTPGDSFGLGSPLLSFKKTLTKNGVDPEVHMNAVELITSKGYPCENHYVTTQDGFILNMQRIPHGRNGNKFTTDGVDQPVVFLQHGLLGSSSNWLDNLVNESLAYMLADKGADVWLGNVRGNTYSSRHVTLNPDQEQFWAWSWDEMAAYDLPAMLDYVQRMTGKSSLHYVGHSQGTTIGFAGFSTNQTLAKLVKRFYALAPIARLGNISLTYLKRLSVIGEKPTLKKLLLDVIGTKGFMTANSTLDLTYKHVMQIMGGFRITSANMTRMPVYFSHTPAGTSVQNILHFEQVIVSGKFQMYDHDTKDENMRVYGQANPPEYPLHQSRVPTVLYCGQDDALADSTDVSWLHTQLPNVERYVTIPQFQHLDFIWALQAAKLCYSHVIHTIFSDNN